MYKVTIETDEEKILREKKHNPDEFKDMIRRMTEAASFSYSGNNQYVTENMESVNALSSVLLKEKWICDNLKQWKITDMTTGNTQDGLAFMKKKGK